MRTFATFLLAAGLLCGAAVLLASGTTVAPWAPPETYVAKDADGAAILRFRLNDLRSVKALCKALAAAPASTLTAEPGTDEAKALAYALADFRRYCEVEPLLGTATLPAPPFAPETFSLIKPGECRFYTEREATLTSARPEVGRHE